MSKHSEKLNNLISDYYEYFKKYQKALDKIFIEFKNNIINNFCKQYDLHFDGRYFIDNLEDYINNFEEIELEEKFGTEFVDKYDEINYVIEAYLCERFDC